MPALITILVLLPLLQVPQQSTSDAVKRLAARLPLVAIESEQPVDLAGRYTGQTSELLSRIGPFLSGEDLYLFPDGSYIYLQWADVMPKTVYDKGTWTSKSGIVELTSDPEITWDPDLGRRHLLVRRTARQQEAMLLAFPEDVDYFEKNAADDPELVLLIVGMARTELLTPTAATALKVRLMKESWNPKVFRR